MTRRLFLFLTLFSTLIGAPDAPAQRDTRKFPRLIVLIAVDQFRYDYLTRFRDQYTAGLSRLLTKGAVFVNANLEHYPTVTAIGHATMLTGATPALSGIMGNDWYDRESKKQVTSVSDDAVRPLGGSAGEGASPRRLLVSTVGDEMKMAGRGSPRVVGVSLKDRSAILPVGHMADGAYWYDTNTGTFVSSTFYFADLPAWVKEFNRRRPSEKYAGAEWNTLDGARLSKLPSETGARLYQAIYDSPFGNELLAAFAEQALKEEKLGQRDSTDLLSISFSSNDAVGHDVGPDAPGVRDISIRTDRVLGELFAAIDKNVGPENYLVVLTADHGVVPLPEKLSERRMPGGRIQGSQIFGPIQAALEEQFGKGNWILATAGTSPYFNLDLVREKKLDFGEVQRVAARAASAAPRVLRVYTREQLLLGQSYADRIGARVLRSFNPRRSGDLEILLEPYWIRSASGTTHGTPYSYDSHIPLIFMGPGIKAGRFLQNVALNDVAPTLASILDIEPPSGSVGRVLHEILQEPQH